MSKIFEHDLRAFFWTWAFFLLTRLEHGKIAHFSDLTLTDSYEHTEYSHDFLSIMETPCEQNQMLRNAHVDEQYISLNSPKTWATHIIAWVEKGKIFISMFEPTNIIRIIVSRSFFSNNWQFLDNFDWMTFSKTNSRIFQISKWDHETQRKCEKEEKFRENSEKITWIFV